MVKGEKNDYHFEGYFPFANYKFLTIKSELMVCNNERVILIECLLCTINNLAL